MASRVKLKYIWSKVERKGFRIWALVFVLLATIIVAGCVFGSNKSENKSLANNKKQAAIPDPSAVYCEGLGYKYEIRTKADGSQSGICMFSDSEECDSWEFFTGKCGNIYSYCEMHDGNIEITTKSCQFSSECAICILPDETECYEWDYFRGDCP